MNVIALFCEDIRYEEDGVNTLVGIIPDNVSMSADASLGSGRNERSLFKLCIYTRIHFDPADNLNEARLVLTRPDAEPLDFGSIDPKTIADAHLKAKETGHPVAGVISRIILGGFKPPKSGLVKMEVHLRDEVHIAGAINFRTVGDTTTSATAPPPPS